MFSEVDTWFYKHLAGIRPGKAGFEKLIIKPCFVQGLEWVRAKYKDIEVFWNGGEIRIKTPVEAELHISGRIYKLEKGCHTIKRYNMKE